MRGKDERGRIGAPHRVFDRRDRFHAVFVEIAENAHETGAQLAAGLLKGRPVDQRILFVHRIIIPRAAPRSPSGADLPALTEVGRSEEHTSELQSLMRISYAVFCLKKKNNTYRKNKEPNIKT